MAIPDRYRYQNHSETETTSVEVEAQLGRLNVGYKGIGEFRNLDGAEGFSGAWSYPHDYDLFSDEAHEDHIKMVTEVAEREMHHQGWNGIDVLIGASISARKEVPHDAAKALRDKGYYIGMSRDYSFACLSGMAGVADVLLDPDLQGARTVVIPYEFLSGNAMSPEDDYKPVRDMFGNGVGWMSFTAGVDIECVYGETIVQTDHEGVIQVPQAFEMDQVTQRLTPPDYYRFVGDSANDFAWTAEGAYMQMPPTPNPHGYTEMNGKKTLRLFAHDGSEHIVNAENFYNTHLKEQYGNPGERWIHQPSKTVITGLQRKILTHLLQQKGFDETEARRFGRLSEEAQQEKLAELGINPINLPWVMESTGINNVSGATSFVMLTEMIKQGRIKPDVVTPAHGFAIGAMFGNYYMIFRQK